MIGGLASEVPLTLRSAPHLGEVVLQAKTDKIQQSTC